MNIIKKLFLINFSLFIIVFIIFIGFVLNSQILNKNYRERNFVEQGEFYSNISKIKSVIETNNSKDLNYKALGDNMICDKHCGFLVIENEKVAYQTIKENNKFYEQAFYKVAKIQKEDFFYYKNMLIYVMVDKNNPNVKYVALHMDNEFYKMYYVKISIFSTLFILSIGLFFLASLVIETFVIKKPVKNLIEATNNIKAGNYDKKTDIIYNDELGGLYRNIESIREKLKQSKKYREETNRDREEYIAGISHDLKTPLTSIMGFSKGLLDGVAKTPEKTKKYAQTIFDTAQGMNTLIEKLKEYSKIDSIKDNFNIKRVNIIDVIDDFIEKNTNSLESRNLILTKKLSMELSENKNLFVKLDSEEFDRVLTNIFNNSIKYNDKEISNCEILVDKADKQCIITIQDDGPGVSEDDLENIFNCFYRGDESRNNPCEGSGLGLYIVKYIINAHNGNIKAINSNGLKLIITLPEVK